MLSPNERPQVGTAGAPGGQTWPCQPTKFPSLATSIEPLVTKADLERILQIDSRTIDRMRATGKLPKPDLFLSRMPRWKPETIRAWIEAGGRQ
jgi:predicted DNA-binding transcriptional regulator AlpA